MEIGNGNGNRNALMRIGDLAKQAGTTLRTIRYYEQLGLIAPASRTKGGFRLYAEEELRKLRLIKNLQLLNIPLAQVKAFFDQRLRGRVAADIAPGIRGVLQQQLREMEDRIAQYRAMQESVQETLEILECCSECPLEPGPEVCARCPVITSRARIPLHMQAVIEAA
ncbi:MAG TPA: MerR family transcriptional regulator [Candidatus Acidoferrum sp.]|nr:MerR family transcriptional regulator [Candidatus Acidoferrum sp.]